MFKKRLRQGDERIITTEEAAKMIPFDAAADTKKRAKKSIETWKLEFGSDGRLDYYGKLLYSL